MSQLLNGLCPFRVDVERKGTKTRGIPYIWVMKQHILTGLKGMAMGIAEVIPGVSGGTIAFITGIYERLISTIKAFGPEVVTAWRTGGISATWQAIHGPFLLAQAFGKQMIAKQWGRIVNISSSWSVVTRPGRLSYSTSKMDAYC